MKDGRSNKKLVEWGIQERLFEYKFKKMSHYRSSHGFFHRARRGDNHIRKFEQEIEWSRQDKQEEMKRDFTGWTD